MHLHHLYVYAFKKKRCIKTKHWCLCFFKIVTHTHIHAHVHTACEIYIVLNLSDIVITVSSKCGSFVSRSSSYGSGSSGRRARALCCRGTEKEMKRAVMEASVSLGGSNWSRPRGVQARFCPASNGRWELRCWACSDSLLLLIRDWSWCSGTWVSSLFFLFLPFSFFPSTPTADRQMFLKGWRLTACGNAWNWELAALFSFLCTFPLCLLSVSITFLVLTWANTGALNISYPLPERRSCKLGTPRQYFSPLPFLFLLKLQLKR